MKNFNKLIYRLISLIFLVCLNINVTYAVENKAINPELQNFIKYMQTKHNFSLMELNKLFDDYVPNKEVLAKISNPTEKLSWGNYKKLLISKDRINKGKEFLIKYRDILGKAEETYGVPKELIVAILGIESFYGERSGKFPVIEALATLSFDYPPRSKFFKQELEEFLLLTKQEKLDPTKIMGSYAGAMSPAQFIPSSYRNYAVDFAKTGSRDLNTMANAIGSIGNYLYKHGWNKYQTIAYPATIAKNKLEYLEYLEQDPGNPHPKHSLVALKAVGVNYSDNHTLSSGPAALIELIVDPEKQIKEYWLGFNNFYVITRYNHSINYAMAVYQLAINLGDFVG